MGEYKRIRQELMYQGKVVGFYKDILKLPNGNTVEWDLIKHPGAAAIIPVLEDGRIILVEQYRNALGRKTFEIPAGGIEKGETPLQCVTREIEEETGYQSNQIEFLIKVITAIGFCDEMIPIYVAKDLVKTEQNLDEDEEIELKIVTIEEAVDMILNGIIIDSKTVSGILAYKETLRS
ncbi:MAG: NUDIX hydrolase [Lachnospiraceae bacterium]|nr:NUDIX hydrolase [Lachnospiraceae bacterium]